MRGLQTIRTGQSLVEGIEVAGAIRRGDVQIGSRQDVNCLGLSERARAVRTTFAALAEALRSAA